MLLFLSATINHNDIVISILNATYITYLCEKTFSKMKFLKSHLQISINKWNLQLILMIGNTNFEPHEMG